MQLPVTAQVTLTGPEVRTVPPPGSLQSASIPGGGSPKRTVQVLDGFWSAVLPPGRYTAVGNAGAAACPVVTFTVPSGLRVAGPVIHCNSD
jgi:hypothetical protein